MTENKTANRFEDMADKLQDTIDALRSDRRTNTPKQRWQATIARYEAERQDRTQAGLRALAAACRNGGIPAALAGVRTKARVYEIMGRDVDAGLGYYEYRETDQWQDNSPEAAALRQLAGLTTEDPETIRQRTLADKLDRVNLLNIPGFYPTPPEVVAQMLRLADIQSGHYVLEPSAGTGNLADAARDAGATVSCWEINWTLAEILELKGHNVDGQDFMEHTCLNLYADRVLMNPPFEKGQDIAHVRKAFDTLKPGGRLIAVMSPGPFFRSDRKAAEFRRWFSGLGGRKVELPNGAFKASGTTASSVLAVIDW